MLKLGQILLIFQLIIYINALFILIKLKSFKIFHQVLVTALKHYKEKKNNAQEFINAMHTCKSLCKNSLFLHFIKSTSSVSLGSFRLHKKRVAYKNILLIAIVHFPRKKGPHTAAARTSSGMDHFHFFRSRST